jgi:hypothetical protein
VSTVQCQRLTLELLTSIVIDDLRFIFSRITSDIETAAFLRFVWPFWTARHYRNFDIKIRRED